MLLYNISSQFERLSVACLFLIVDGAADAAVDDDGAAMLKH